MNAQNAWRLGSNKLCIRYKCDHRQLLPIVKMNPKVSQSYESKLWSQQKSITALQEERTHREISYNHQLSMPSASMIPSVPPIPFPQCWHQQRLLSESQRIARSHHPLVLHQPSHSNTTQSPRVIKGKEVESDLYSTCRNVRPGLLFLFHVSPLPKTRKNMLEAKL